MSAQHTPGPWMEHGPSRPMPGSPEGGDYCIMDGGTNVIGEAFFRVHEGVGGTRNAAANARLMAAAPDLLSSLKELVEIVEDAISQRSAKDLDSFTLQPAMDAIARATGGST